MYDMDLAVKRGATFLDEYSPGWAEYVGRDDLLMNSCSKCVLGQLYGDYWAALHKYSKEMDAWGQMEWENDHGFNLPTDESIGMARDNAWDELRDKWIDQIVERLV